jgi:hypothetical protein
MISAREFTKKSTTNLRYLGDVKDIVWRIRNQAPTIQQKITGKKPKSESSSLAARPNFALMWLFYRGFAI